MRQGITELATSTRIVQSADAYICRNLLTDFRFDLIIAQSTTSLVKHIEAIMTDKSKQDFLDVFPEFRLMSDELLAEIFASARRQTIPAGQHVYSEGDLCQLFLFLLSGEIRVYKTGASGKEITLYDITSGETCIVNASCILSGAQAPANALAQTECDALLLPSHVFQRLAGKYEEVRSFVFKVLAINIANVMSLVEEVAFERMDERLADYLMEKARDGKLQTTHQKIANDLGTSREVVSRLLKDFERQGKLVLSRNLITLN